MCISTSQQLYFPLVFLVKKRKIKHLQLFSFDTIIATTRHNNGWEVDFFKSFFFSFISFTRTRTSIIYDYSKANKPVIIV